MTTIDAHPAPEAAQPHSCSALSAAKARFDLALRDDLRASLATSYAEFLGKEKSFLAHFASIPSPPLRERRHCPLCQGKQWRFLFHSHGLAHVQCRDCAFVFTAQLADAAADQARYQQHEAMAMRSALVTQPAWRALEAERAKYIFDRLREHGAPLGKLLDIGAGAGNLLIAARCLGIMAEGIEINAAYRDCHRQAGLTVHYGVFPDDFSDSRLGRFDAVLLLDILEHTPDPIIFLGMASRFLDRGGLLAVQTPNFASLLLQIEGAANHNFCPGHWNHFTPATLAAAGERAGLQPIFIDNYISELHRIGNKPWPKIAETIFAMTGKQLTSPIQLTPEFLYDHRLGYKAFVIFAKTHG